MDLHAIISTHTTRHLRLTLLGVACQSEPAASVVLSVDNDREDVRDLARACCREFGLRLILASRTFPGEVRVGQVRNNGVRALLSGSVARPSDDDLLYFLDGDSAAPRTLFADARRLGARADMLVGGRVCLTEEQTEAFDEAAFRQGRPPAMLGREQSDEVRRRDRRYRRQRLLKPLGLVKMHKPKVLGASHGVRLRKYVEVNGYDESFLGAWREDDDFGRRVYLSRGRSVVAVADLCVYHLWHPLNPGKREGWVELPGKSPREGGIACTEGLNSPRNQASLKIEVVEPNGRGGPTTDVTASLRGGPVVRAAG